MKHCRHWPNDRHSGYFNGIAYCLGGENKYAAAVWTGEKSTSRWTSATCDAMGGPPASATSSGDYCALHDAPTDCLRMRTPGVGAEWQLFSGNLSFHLQNCVRRSPRRRHKFSSVKIIPAGRQRSRRSWQTTGRERASEREWYCVDERSYRRCRTVVKAVCRSSNGSPSVAILFGEWRPSVFIVMAILCRVDRVCVRVCACVRVCDMMNLSSKHQLFCFVGGNVCLNIADQCLNILVCVSYENIPL